MPPLLLGILLLVGLLLVTAALGHRLLRALHVAISDPSEHAVFAVGLGMGALQSVPFLLLACGIARPLVFRAVMFLLACVLWSDVRAIAMVPIRWLSMKGNRSARQPADVGTPSKRPRNLPIYIDRVMGVLAPRERRAWQWLLIGTFATLFLALGLRAVCPITDDDGLSYHLAAAVRLLDAGRFAYLPTLTYTNWPLGVESLFVLLRALHPDAPVGMVQFAFGATIVAAVYLYGRRLGGALMGAGAVSLLLVYKVFWEEMTQAHVDLGLAAFATLSVFALAHAVSPTLDSRLSTLDSRVNVAWLRLSALFAGLAATTKLNGLWVIAAMAVVVLLMNLHAATSAEQPIGQDDPPSRHNRSLKSPSGLAALSPSPEELGLQTAESARRQDCPVESARRQDCPAESARRQTPRFSATPPTALAGGKQVAYVADPRGHLGMKVGTETQGSLFSRFSLRHTVSWTPLRGTRGASAIQELVRLPAALRRTLTYGAMALCIVVPWSIRTWILTGNPVYPTLYNLFGGREWTAEGWPRLQFSFLLYTSLPGMEPVRANLLLARALLVGIALIVAVLVFRATRSSSLALPARFAATVSPLLLFGSGYNLRYLLPAYPCVALCAASMFRGREKPLAPVVCLLALLLAVRVGGSGLKPDLRTAASVALGRISHEEYLRGVLTDYPVIEYANRNLPSNARVLVGTWEEDTAYYRAFALRANYWLQDSVHYDSPARLEADLKRLHVQYLVYKPMEAAWCVRSSICRGRMETETRALGDLARRRGTKLFEVNGVALFRLDIPRESVNRRWTVRERPAMSIESERDLAGITEVGRIVARTLQDALS